MKTNVVPNSRSSVTPCLSTPEAARLVDFLKHAFGGSEQSRVLRPDGTVLYAEVRLGDSVVLITDPKDHWKPRPSILNLHVPDVDATFERAVAAGGKPISRPTNMFYGDRQAVVSDISNNHWWIRTHIEDLSSAEIQARAATIHQQKLN
jgi:PhnB protein